MNRRRALEAQYRRDAELLDAVPVDLVEPFTDAPVYVIEPRPVDGQRPWMWTQAPFGVRVGLTILGWIYGARRKGGVR